ncbi:MAG: DUF3160 domain-containing protein, partial [Candidatus Aenigmarchaeota archaeon]|nr:DUF3160 domain-containing protein [Candidatus Aenigmarchaeota archaeon]
MKISIKILSIFLIVALLFSSGCAKETIVPEDTVPVDDIGKTDTGTLKIQAVDLSDIQDEKLEFVKYYSLNELNIELKTAQYNLPLKTSQISNYKDFSRKVFLDNKTLNLLNKNGFAVTDNLFNLKINSKEEDITNPYKTLKDKEIPVFITSDSLLHLYHIQFDETLRQIEEGEFYDGIWEISKELLDDSAKNYQMAAGS